MVINQTISSQEESETSENLQALVNQEQEGSELLYISLSDNNSVEITLNIPENWSRDAESILDENEMQIGSLWTKFGNDTPQTYIPVDLENPFAEAEEMIDSIFNSPSYETRDFTVNDLPVRAYYYGTGEDGPDFLTDAQYAYFIVINDEVLGISFHTRINVTIYSQADFDKIINSFTVVS